MTEHYRQGDVLLMKVESLPPDAVKDSVSDNIVLALGEVTGHSHRLEVPQGATLYTWNDDRLVEINHPGKLLHEEHDTIPLSPGFYKVVIQREYTPGRIVRVSD